jgi:hypothetical protein
VTVENFDLGDLVDFARDLNLTAPDALDRVVHFAGSVMINIGAPDVLQRVNSLRRGTARKEPTEVERVALSFRERAIETVRASFAK